MSSSNRAFVWQRVRSGLVGTCLALATLPALATPPIQAPALRQQPIAADAEKIERVVVYYRSLGVQHAKPSTGGLPAVPDPSTDPTGNAALSPDDASKLPTAPADAEDVRSAFTNAVTLETPRPMTPAEAQAWVASVAAGPDVLGVLVDRQISSHGAVTSNDTLAYVLWNLATGDAGSTNTEPVWPNGKGTGIRVAVLDTGRVQHPDMNGVWLGGYDFISTLDNAGDNDARDANPDDTMTCQDSQGWRASNPHGLQVASIIAARLNNNEGLAGVAPEANIVPVRVISGCGGFLSDVLDGMRWAVGLPVAGVPLNPDPARILNLSLGTTSPGVACSAVTQQVIDEVRGTGAVIVVSTGNDGADAISVPASCNGVIAVTAATRDGKRADYANAGAGTALAAAGGGCAVGALPGCTANAYNYVPVASDDGNPKYVMGAGTSYAAPHVAGAAALLLERNPTRSADEITSILVNSARAFAANDCAGNLCGTGILDVNTAVNMQGFSLMASASATTVRSGTSVVLSAQASSAAIYPVYAWQQTLGPAVVLAFSPDGREASFTAPAADAILGFEVSATDNSAMERHASLSVNVSIAPVLAPIGPIEVAPNATVRQSLTLTDGSSPESVAVDASSLQQGVAIQGTELVWTNPPVGMHQIEVTPFDNVGAGVPAQVQVDVKVASASGATNASSNASANPMGGGGALGWHGAVLLLLAWLARRRLVAERSGWAVPAILIAGSVLLFVAGAQAPLAAWSQGADASALWSASLVHIDGLHLMTNLAGLLLVQWVFGSMLDGRAWFVALGVAAPIAHLVAVNGGHLAWVAGLSSGLHAVVAFALASAFIGQFGHRLDGMRVFTMLAAAGLMLKVVLDLWLVTSWPAAGAQSSALLHALAAVCGGFGGLLVAGLTRRVVSAKRPQSA